MEKYRDNPTRLKILTYLFENYARSFSENLTLESDEDFIYLSDIVTYELYLISTANSENVTSTWGDYKGRKCYEVLQNRTEPCPFCTNHLLSQDQYYIWKHYNDVINKNYILKDKLVEWEGKIVRMEVVMDISNISKIDRALRRSLDGQNLLSSCMMALIETDQLKEAAEKLLVKICRFFGADEGFFEYFNHQDIIISWKNDEGTCQITDHAAVFEGMQQKWAKLLDKGKQIIINSQDQLQDSEEYVGDFMKRYDIRTFCITPAFSGKRLLGLIGIKNIKVYWTELSLLSMVGNHISARLMKEELQRENERILYSDATTGYLNFEGFKKRAEQILADNPHRKYALWYSDLKKFKYINDVRGYEVGDLFLKHWADSIAKVTQDHETFGRIGGDKFVVLRSYEDRDELNRRFQTICRTMNSLAAQYGNIHTDLASGIYLMERTEDRLSLNEMLDRANIAEKHMKEKPGSTMAFYDEEMRSKVVREIELESALMDALEREEFHLYLQPQVPLKEDEYWCAEALVRWIRKEDEIVYPGDFIELFERDGMIYHLDHYMFIQVCCYIKKHEKLVKKPLRISVNVSRVTMMRPDFVETYCRIKDFYGIADGSISLEFTESVVVDNHIVFQDIVSRLKECGFWSAMDDFGANQSSLNVLKNVPLDTLKLDKKFFDMEEDDSRRTAVLTCVLQLASNLNMETVAEGVETMELVETLRDMDCDYIQGYVYSKPMPAEDYIDFMRDQSI